MAAQLDNSRTAWTSVAPLLVLLTWFSTGADQLVASHPVSVTVTHVYVSEELATAKIQVFLEDLYLFHNLQPDDAEFLDREAIERGIELHKRFIVERFVIRALSGDAIPGRIVNVQDEDVPADGVPLSDLMAHQITFEIEYELPSPPEFLTFSQQFTDEEGMLPSEMKLIVKQENAGNPETVVLRPDDLETMRFDWNLPPLSPEASEAEREGWAAKQKEETLGITSYSSVYSFLYVEDHEVRHEILIPLLTLEQNVLIARDDDEYLDIAEQDAARQQIEAYFQSGNPVEIDGAVVSGVVRRCDFYGLDFRDFAMRAQRKSVPIVTARVGIILAYPSIRAPRSVRLTWNRFSNFVWTINTVVFTFDEIIKTSLSRLGGRNVFQWEGPPRAVVPPPEQVRVTIPPATMWHVPILSLAAALAGLLCLAVLTRRRTALGIRIGLFTLFSLVVAITWAYTQRTVPTRLAARCAVSPEQADAIFETLHTNLYRALEYRSESEIYDVLAVSASGPFLRDVYLQLRKGLEMAEQGGAVARVKEVSIVSGERETRAADGASGGQAFVYRCRWNVAGTVEHWGHIHERTNQYEAIFSVKAIDDVWKVTNLELTDELRLQFETRLRGS